MIIKSYTLTEIIVVIAIIVLISSAIISWISSIENNSETIWTSEIVNSYLRNEKTSILSWETECSQMEFGQGFEFFTIFQSRKVDWKCQAKPFFTPIFDWSRVLIGIWPEIKDYTFDTYRTSKMTSTIKHTIEDKYIYSFPLQEEGNYSIKALTDKWKWELNFSFTGWIIDSITYLDNDKTLLWNMVAVQNQWYLEILVKDLKIQINYLWK